MLPTLGEEGTVSSVAVFLRRLELVVENVRYCRACKRAIPTHERTAYVDRCEDCWCECFVRDEDKPPTPAPVTVSIYD